MDEWEAAQLWELKSEFRMVEDALTRAQDQLTEEDLERSEWAYTYTQLSRAQKILDTLKRRLLRVRTRRLSLPLPKHVEHDEG